MNIEKSRIKEIVTLHEEVSGLLKMSLDKAIRIGELLTEQKATLKHGEWLPWVNENLPFTDRTARNYMKVFRSRHEIKTENVSDLTGAYHLLVAQKLEISELSKAKTENPEPKPLPTLDEYVTATTKIMFDLMNRVNHIYEHIENVSSFSIFTEFELHIKDLVESLELTKQRIAGEKEDPKRKVVTNKCVGEELPTRKYHLTEKRLTALKEHLNKVLEMLNVKVGIHAPVKHVRFELGQLKEELNSLDTYR